MPEEFSPQVTSEMGAIDTVARRSDNLADQSKDVATNLYGIDRATKDIQAEGVLTDGEKDNSNSYTEKEFQAMSVEDKRNFLSELQSMAKEKSPMFVLELQKNKKEGELFKLAMAYSKTEQALQQKMESFKDKKAEIEEKHAEQAAKATEKYEKDSEKIKSKSKGKIRKLAGKLKKDSSVKSFREDVQKQAYVQSRFNYSRNDEISKGISEARDQVKEDDNVANLIDQISAERNNLDEKLQERKQQLLTELANIEQGTKRELNQLKGSTLAELNELKQQLSQIEQERDQAEQEFTDLESQIEDKQRLQDSVDLLKDELREFSFADGQKVMADVENRAANTLSMEALSADKENFEGQLEVISDGITQLNADLAEAEDLAINANESSYADQLKILEDEEDRLLEERLTIHKDLEDQLYRPYVELEIESRALDLSKPKEVYNMGKKRAEIYSKDVTKRVDREIFKSQTAVEKFTNKLMERFSKLKNKLETSRVDANQEVYSTVNAIDNNLYTAQTIIDQAKEGDFSQVAEKENWLKATFSKLFAKK